MKVYKFVKKQHVNVSQKTAWNFFSAPNNLKEITPDYMGFDILDTEEEKMYPGQIISYFVSPLFCIKMRWTTEITHVVEPHYFVDEQRFGPYSFWHHKHFINESPNGGLDLVDIIHYGVPFGFIGRIANSIIVRKKIEEIFNYRTKKIEEIFK